MEAVMSPTLIVATLLALGLLAYLCFALLKPEEFQ
jgi:K+-transporting ATPase KdpF subunit